MVAATLYLIAGLLAVGAVYLTLRGVIGDRAKGRKRCPKCWYDMRAATSLVCPECGHDAKDSKNLLRTRRSYRRVVLGAIVMALAAHLVVSAGRVRWEREDVRFALVPTTVFAVVWPELGGEWRYAAVKRVIRCRQVCSDTFVPTRVSPVEGNLARTLTAHPIAWQWQIDLFVWRGVRAKCDARRANPILISDITSALEIAPRSCRYTGLLLDDPNTLSLAEKTGMMDTLAHCAQYGQADEVVQIALSHPEVFAASDRSARIFAVCPLATWEALRDEDLVKAIDIDTSASRKYRSLYWMDARLLALSKRPHISQRKLAELYEIKTGTFLVNQIAVLTALRRTEGNADPLAVRTEERSLHWTSQEKGPVIHASLWNVDKVNPEQVAIQWGGDNRGSRAERWRLSLRTPDGREQFAPADSTNFGGKFSHGHLEPDKPWKTELSIDAYIERPAPGRYSLVVQYHDAQQISMMRDVSELIVFESAPIELIVE